MLEIKNLTVEIEGRIILEDINITIPKGETHILFGPNGSGKTTLLMAVMGFPMYKVVSGEIIYNGEKLNSLPLEERAKKGLGVFYQRPPTIKGVSLEELSKIIMKKNNTELKLDTGAGALNIEKLMQRDINRGFSGGEIKRSELLQLFAQKPSFVLFDEPESGVDVENMKLIGGKIRQLLERDIKKENRSKSSLIITHTGHILDYVDADLGYTLISRKIKCKHEPARLFKQIQRHGFRECEICEETA